ncbi:MAG: FAD-binding oxidoreductase [Bacillota bacterium]
MTAQAADLYKELVDIVGEENLSSDQADLIPYMKDSYTALMRKAIPFPDFVVMPRSTGEVQGIIRLANKYRVPVYPRSFGVNIAGSAVPYAGGLVLDLKRMNRILEINEDTMTAYIEPGVSWGQLRKEARKKRLDIIPIGGPYDTSPVGNFLLTNITPYSTKYPADRAVTLEAVLPNGEIIRTGSQATRTGAELNPYFRYAYGPDITGLFRGSLGNYGIITRLMIRLRPLAEVEKNVYYAFDSLEPALEAMKIIERLEITRYSMLSNRHLSVRIAAHPDDLRDGEKRDRIMAGLPEYQLVVGLGGKPRQVDLYEEMVAEEITPRGGREAGFDDATRAVMDEMTEGASQKVLRMFAPNAGFAAVIGCVPAARARDLNAAVREAVKKHGLKDALSGRPLEPELIVIPYDRCSTVYVEHEILYDPLDSEGVQLVNNCLRECYARLVMNYGAVHTMPNRSLLRVVLPSYAELLTGIKKMVDPNGIMMPGGPYTLEEKLKAEAQGG